MQSLSAYCEYTETEVDGGPSYHDTHSGPSVRSGTHNRSTDGETPNPTPTRTMTCKMVILAPRKEGMSHEDCIEYMEEEHVPLVEELPGLRKYETAIPLDPDEAGFDEMAQLWFDDPGEMNAAFESEAGQAVQEDAANFVDLEEAIMIPVTDETVRVDEFE